MPLTDELCALFRRNFPYVIRAEEAVRAIFSHPENHVISRRNEQGHLYAAAVVQRSTILMICVDEPYRRLEIGSELLQEAEAWIRSHGYPEAVIGVGLDYLCPGVPVREQPYPEALIREGLDPRIPAENAEFFRKRGYFHAWDDSNCFDMQMDLTGDVLSLQPAGGFACRWAGPEDRTAVMACTDDALPEFTKFYASEELYLPGSPDRVLIALDGELVCGALLVSRETEAKGVGSIGCTSVRRSHRGRKVASDLVLLAVKALYESGLPRSYLSYTYSGLDRLYGSAGYAISCYYFMAKKRLDTQDDSAQS